MSATQDGHGVRGFAHVGIIVPELDTAATLFRDRLGAEVRGPEDEPELGLKILWVRVGGVLLEFVAPARDDSRADRRCRTDLRRAPRLRL